MNSSTAMGNFPEPLNLNLLFSNSTASSVMDNFLEVLIFNWLFLKLNQFICDRWFSWSLDLQPVISQTQLAHFWKEQEVSMFDGPATHNDPRLYNKWIDWLLDVKFGITMVQHSPKHSPQYSPQHHPQLIPDSVTVLRHP